MTGTPPERQGNDSAPARRSSSVCAAWDKQQKPTCTPQKCEHKLSTSGVKDLVDQCHQTVFYGLRHFLTHPVENSLPDNETMSPDTWVRKAGVSVQLCMWSRVPQKPFVPKVFLKKMPSFRLAIGPQNIAFWMKQHIWFVLFWCEHTTRLGQ